MTIPPFITIDDIDRQEARAARVDAEAQRRAWQKQMQSGGNQMMAQYSVGQANQMQCANTYGRSIA